VIRQLRWKRNTAALVVRNGAPIEHGEAQIDRVASRSTSNDSLQREGRRTFEWFSQYINLYMDQIMQPTKEQVRQWLRHRYLNRRPLPAIEQIKFELRRSCHETSETRANKQLQN